MAEPVDIRTDGSQEEPIHGWAIAVKDTPTALGPAGLAPDRVTRGFLIRAPGRDDDTPNTQVVYVGAKKVTANQNIATGGTPIPPGASVTIFCRDPSKLFVITTGDDPQPVSWLGV